MSSVHPHTSPPRMSLHEKEEQLRPAIDAAEVGLWDVDVATGALYWPARVKAMFGISPEADATLDDFVACMHPEDAPAVLRAFAAAQDPALRTVYDVEYRTVGKEDGRVRWVAYHVCDWLTPTRDLLSDRGMMGDGVVELKKIRGWVEAAGFTGFSEVEIFSNLDWWQRPGAETLDVCISRHKSAV